MSSTCSRPRSREIVAIVVEAKAVRIPGARYLQGTDNPKSERTPTSAWMAGSSAGEWGSAAH